LRVGERALPAEDAAWWRRTLLLLLLLGRTPLWRIVGRVARRTGTRARMTHWRCLLSLGLEALLRRRCRRRDRGRVAAERELVIQRRYLRREAGGGGARWTAEGLRRTARRSLSLSYKLLLLQLLLL
jgi:hypothetical protein